MKCLITDEVYEGIAEALKDELELTVTGGMPLSHEELLDRIGEYDILIMRVFPNIDRVILDAAKNLKMICVCAVGTNHIDMDYAKEKGILVRNATGLNANAVAELTITMMLNMSRDTIAADLDVKVHHNWDKYAFMGRELRGKTLGLLGFGQIGHRVAELAKAFQMDIVAFDPNLSPEHFEAAGVRGMSVEEILPIADFISIHVPLTPRTKHMFNRETISKMKDGAVLLNMSRGGIVCEEDMYEALQEGRIGGYAADVMEYEVDHPGVILDDSLRSPLFECENFLVTPHIGAETKDAARDIGVYIIKVVKEFLSIPQ
ncbi:MAG: NAD(P)-dependent oxidoreductase [Eubacteriales bacterium]|nr:NAD(P)-dependent oxidoreductase [Eubacteriales bacterium]